MTAIRVIFCSCLVVLTGFAGSVFAETVSSTETSGQKMCVYSSYSWNAKNGSTSDHRKVVKPYSDVTPDERDPEEPGCTVCQIDQVEIRPVELGISNIAPFMVCHLYADRIRQALVNIVASGDFDLMKIVGYRPGRTRGPIVNGLRTVLSNHSFGTAIDINSDSNGLYGNCTMAQFDLPDHGGCRLRIGGIWNPSRRPRTSITVESIVYKELTRFFKWGGEIEGSTRDLMHFSVTGY